MPHRDSLADQWRLIRALMAQWQRQGMPVQLFETHISWVLVAGGFAYKIKKALRFDFLDFSTLVLRRFYCEEEVRLNRRLAPELYLGVVAIGGSPGHPSIEDEVSPLHTLGAGRAPIDYAVKMRTFEQDALWIFRLAQHLLTASEIDDLAQAISAFHRNAERAPAGKPWGEATTQQSIADENLATLEALTRGTADSARVQRLRDWETGMRSSLVTVFAQRKAHGWVRECHGDLHAGNILTSEGRVQVFDCIEFNERMRWIDVINDIAFTCMDLQFRGRGELAARFLNQYLEASGDYAGLAVLHYYLVHRALVRCKVTLLRERQMPAAAPMGGVENDGRAYLAFALKSTEAAPAAIAITHGFSGSGKSTVAACLLEAWGAVRLRSDVERKRMRGLEPAIRGAGELYTDIVTQETYARLAALARQVVAAGYPVIVDAAFLKAGQRRLFHALAAELGVPFFILDVHASEATMRARLNQRERVGRDPSDAGVAILEWQIASHEPLTDSERAAAIRIDLESGIAEDALRAVLETIQSGGTVHGRST